MRKVELLLIVIVIVFSTQELLGQLLTDNFDYAGGEQLTSHGWSAHSGSGVNPILVSNSGLTYPGYEGSGIGNAATIIGGSGSREDVNRGFTEQSVNGTTIYYSLLVEVGSASTSEGYFFHIGNRTSPTSFLQFCARVFVQDVSGNIRFGISNTTVATMGATDFSTGVTYLVIVKYTINTSGNDECKLWVLTSGVPNSEVNAGMPEVTNSTTAGQDVVDAVGLRQGTESYNVKVDAIRIANSWSLTPLPVELSSFSAVVLGKGVKLSWRTETELNNYGFEVERKTKDARGETWGEIGFVEGNGNSNSPKEYSFIDDEITSGKYAYRLKQIDNDGKFEYSKIIEIDVDAPLEFELSQNYPNPFNPTTTIKYLLPLASKVKLSVFNILGEEIQILINETKEAGVYTINFNASKLNSGIYFYKLETENFLEVKKMSLIK